MVIRLKPENAEALRKLRPEAITLHPTAFTTDSDMESRLTLMIGASPGDQCLINRQHVKPRPIMLEFLP